jgi:hypothetical protein
MGPDWDLNNGPQFSKLRPVILLAMGLFFCRDIVKGQSIGRYILGVGVRSADSPTQIPTIPKLITRNLFLVIWPIEFFALAFSSKRLRIGDRITGTRVLRVPAAWKPRLLAAAAVLVACACTTFFGISAVTRNSAAYRVATEHLRSDASVIAELGAVESFGAFPGGGIEVVNGYGTADLFISVQGSSRSIRARVRMAREPDQPWLVQEITLQQ